MYTGAVCRFPRDRRVADDGPGGAAAIRRDRSGLHLRARAQEELL